MKRWIGPVAGWVAAASCAAALGGWALAFDGAGPGRAESSRDAIAVGVPVELKLPASDGIAEPELLAFGGVAGLERLADGMLAPTGRLWVVGVRTPDGLLRWSGDDAGEAARWIERAEAALPDADGPSNWFVNVQGALAAPDLADVWVRIEKAADAKLLDAYADAAAGTYSFSYSSPRFGMTVGEGAGAIGLQAAAHRDTETGIWRVTLGTPAVLLEY